MFRSIIRGTQLTSDGANKVFKHIIGESFNGDITFLSTLRALVASRMSDRDSIRLHFTSSNYSERTIAENLSKKIIQAICMRSCAEGSSIGNVIIHNFDNTIQKNNRACMNLIESSFEQEYEGWYRLKKVTDFYLKNFLVLCYINPEKKNVYIFTENMDIGKMHYLQCSIFAFLPWYFNPKDGVSELEMDLINSLREKTPTKYLDCIARIASQYDFRGTVIRDLLAGFETRYMRKECEGVRSDIQNIINKIESADRLIAEYLQEKSGMEIRLLGLESKIEQDEDKDSEIMEYFLCNKSLVLNDVNDRYLTFSCMGYLTYFDEDMAKQIIDNERSFIYLPEGRDCSGIIQKEDMKKLMYAIFIDQTLRIKMCCAYKLDLNGDVRGLSNYEYGPEFLECTPNTHIDKYSCIGDYRRAINHLLSNHDYIGAIEQCIASCKSLNFADSTVMEEFMKRFYGISEDVNIRCIELPDGKVVTPKDAIAWINAQEPEQHTQEGKEPNE